jgi:hypothetical protein
MNSNNYIQFSNNNININHNNINNNIENNNNNKESIQYQSIIIHNGDQKKISVYLNYKINNNKNNNKIENNKFKLNEKKDTKTEIEEEYMEEIFSLIKPNSQSEFKVQKNSHIISIFIPSDSIFIYAYLLNNNNNNSNINNNNNLNLNSNLKTQNYLYKDLNKLIDLDDNNKIIEDNFTKKSREGYIIITAFGKDASVFLKGLIEEEILIRENFYQIFSRPKGNFIIEIIAFNVNRKYLITSGRSYYVLNSTILIDKDLNIVLPLFTEEKDNNVFYGDMIINKEIRNNYDNGFIGYKIWKENYENKIGNKFKYEYECAL